MTSPDISEKHTSQNAMSMKLGQQVLGEKKIQMSMSQQILGDVIMISSFYLISKGSFWLNDA